MITTIGKLLELSDSLVCIVNGSVVGYQIPFGLVSEPVLTLKLARFQHVNTHRQAGQPTRHIYTHNGYSFEVALFATFATVRGYDGT